MAQFFLRTIKTAGSASLYVVVNRPKYGVRWKLNTGISVEVATWTRAQSSAKSLMKYYDSEEGRAVREKTDKAERVIDEYFKGLGKKAAEKKELERRLAQLVNTDIEAQRKKLDELRADKLKLRVELAARKKTEVLAYYEDFMEGITNGEIRHSDNARYTARSLVAWRTFGVNLKGFLKKNGLERLTFDDITKRTATAFVTYCEDKEMMKTTISILISNFRKLCNHAAESGVNTNAVSLKVWKTHLAKDGEKRAEIALTDEEISAIYDLPLTGKLEECRDIWVLGYFSAQRVSDFSVLTKDNFLINADGTPVISLRQQKTGAEVEVPIIDDRVFELGEKYAWTFPRWTRDALNRKIKLVCKLLVSDVPSFAAWESTLLTANERKLERWFMDARNRVAAGERLRGEDAKRFKKCAAYAAEHESGEYLFLRDYKGDVIRQRWELVTCHTTRRSAITNLHRTGLLSDREIMSVSGHQTLRSYEIYMKVQKSERATSIYEKMKRAKEVKMKKEA